jgi:hypothetical protein
MFQKIDTQRKSFTPAAVGSNETKALFDVSEGDSLLWADAELLVAADASTTSTQTLGDGVDPGGFVTSANLDLESGTVGTVVQGTGALLVASGGKLYAADDTIDVVYTAGTPGATPPVIRYTVHILRALH